MRVPILPKCVCNSRFGRSLTLPKIGDAFGPGGQDAKGALRRDRVLSVKTGVSREGEALAESLSRCVYPFCRGTFAIRGSAGASPSRRSHDLSRTLTIRDRLNPARIGFGDRLARLVSRWVVEFRKVRKRI
jgi:hypothetical protein